MKKWVLFYGLILFGTGLSLACETRPITLIGMLRADASVIISEVVLSDQNERSLAILETLSGDTPTIDSAKIPYLEKLPLHKKVLMLVLPKAGDDLDRSDRFLLNIDKPQGIEHVRSLLSLDYSFQETPDQKQTAELGLWLAEAAVMPGLYRHIISDLTYVIKHHQENGWAVDPMIYELVESVLLERKWDAELLSLAGLLETESYCIRNKVRDEIWNLREFIRTAPVDEVHHKTGVGLFYYFQYGVEVTELEWLIDEYEEAFEDWSPEQLVPVFDELLTEIIMNLDAEAACYR